MGFIGHRPRAVLRPRQRERGYVLLTLMLMVALLVVAAAAIVPTISFEIRRDREEELIHRGVQYSRAIRAYYKKFGRYPTRLEDLESANNLRFLRKRYKDPVTGQDFKLLHFGEVKLSFTGGIGGGTIPGANAIGTPAAGGVNGPGALPQSSAFGGNSNSALGASSNGFGGNSNGGLGASSNSQTNPGQQGTNSAPGSDPTQASSQVHAPGQGDESSSGQQLVAGGPIVGVVSTSKKESIREFNHKKKYEEWQFVYDPSSDRGGLLSTPNQPPLQGFAGQQPNQQNQNGSPFGPPAGMQNNPNLMGPGGPGTPTPPPTTPPTTSPQQQ